MIHKEIPNRIKSFVKGEEFGNSLLCVEIIAVSCYKNEQVTFWIKGEGGWYYGYVPLNYLSLSDLFIDVQTKNFLCKSQVYEIVPKFINEDVNLPEGLGEILFSLDFLEENEILHVCALKTGPIRIYPHRNFICDFPPMKKMRKIWK